jgi:hypothetical protein
MELTRVRERGQDDRSSERLGDLERAVEVFAADVVDELAILGVPLEHVGAHQVDERRRIRDAAEEAAARFHLDDLDAFVRKHPPVVEGLRAHNAHVVTASRETGRELVREAFGPADARVCTLREKELHCRAM